MAKITTTTSRRAVLAGVAAVPALGLPAIAVPKLEQSRLDPVAELARVKDIVERLETRVICDGWKPDCEGNARLLRYFEWAAANPEISPHDTSDEWMWAIHFLHDNGQSLDWVLFGDPGPMLSYAAGRSRRADAELVELGRQFDAKAEIYEEACRRWKPNWEAHARAYAAGSPFAIHKQIDREYPIAHPHPDDILDHPMESLQRRIMELPARTPEGLAVKARVVRFSCSNFWDATEDDRDWDQLMVTKLVETIELAVQS